MMIEVNMGDKVVLYGKRARITKIHDENECTIQEDGICGVSYRVYTKLLARGDE